MNDLTIAIIAVVLGFALGFVMGVRQKLWGDHVRVRFAIGDYFRGKPAPPIIKGQYGYKTLRQSELRGVEA